MSLVSSLKPFYLLRDFSADLPMSEICVKVFHFFSTAALTLCSKNAARMFIWNMIAELVAGSIHVVFEEEEPY